YLDASALVKRYVAEPGSSAVEQAIAAAEAAGTTMISRVEVVAAFGRALNGEKDEKDEKSNGWA
ncbi:MAG: type II toxin-antitoxin system VapC family toxin, partial [bacterium]|nr:type II toxin-antitoxin system VapC family toxin [bacterium]